ncbi:hypothetical protein DL96DRAFT_1716041 [Flagelloscypha sp. PMI_526]|nr:hypothetical protein DL96DRAFT_1716041 [Flagelloscypha sp. PMI_526]
MFHQFLKLPPELQEFVVQWAGEEDEETALSVSLVSPSFRVWISPRLFRILNIEDGTKLKRLLDSTAFRHLRGCGAVRVVAIAWIEESEKPLLEDFLSLTRNLTAFLLRVDGDFRIPDSTPLPKLHTLFTFQDLSFSMPTNIVQQLTHLIHAIDTGGPSGLDELIRWLTMPLKTLTHLFLFLEFRTQEGEDGWQSMFQLINYRLLPVLPTTLRVFVVQPESVPDLEELDPETQDLLAGRVDGRIVFAPISALDEDTGDVIVPASLPEVFLCHQSETTLGETLHIRGKNTEGIWTVAEDFVKQRNEKNIAK